MSPGVLSRSVLGRGIAGFRREFLWVGVFSLFANVLMLTPALLGGLAQGMMGLRPHYARRRHIHCHDCHVALLLPPEEQQDYLGCGAGIATAGIRAKSANGLALQGVRNLVETVPSKKPCHEPTSPGDLGEILCDLCVEP